MSRIGNIAAVILAAGYSTRLKAWKPLLTLGDSTFIEAAVRSFRTAGVADIRVVTGHRAAELAPVLEKLKVRAIFNPDYDQGMFTSVREGVSSLEREIEAFFLLPVDIPLVQPQTILALMRAYYRSGALIIYPGFQGKRGHPPLIATACVAGLPADCDGGLRAFLRRYHDVALDLQVADEGVLLDCDSPADYEHLLAYGRRQDLVGSGK